MGLPISPLERRANKKTREKGRNLEPRNARVHAFRGNFHQVIHVRVFTPLGSILIMLSTR